MYLLFDKESDERCGHQGNSDKHHGSGADKNTDEKCDDPRRAKK
jgi:hypothetical protein